MGKCYIEPINTHLPSFRHQYTFATMQQPNTPNSPITPPTPPATTVLVAPPTHALAIVSLVSGILAWLCIPLLGSFIAVITGHLARSAIGNQPTLYGGDGLAVLGLVLGYLQLAIALISVLVVMFFFGGMAFFLGDPLSSGV